MFSSVLIANRGEIACRIIRTARQLGLRTIAVYSHADAGAPHVRLADEAHAIGPAPAAQSYLAIDKVVAAARRSGAACVHPGYGFLAENAEFAEACAAAGIVFVGPPPAAIRAMGLKDRAKALMRAAGVPVVPGYDGASQDAGELKQQAAGIGYPVLIKAVAGGGGKGMRRVERPAEFDDALAAARREATSAFGDGRVLIERYVASPRHIEVQIFADRFGNVVHLNERDCSLQRRHQKVIEEAPAPGLAPELRERIGAAAVAAAKAVHYVGAGTVEFIADGSGGLRADRFWFMEMNTRLQVEHPVTEAVTGTDLVAWQLRIAAGEKLPLTQAEVTLSGHAVEARLYAEDPERGFLPATGRIVALTLPEGEGIRVDSGVEAGSEVSPYYDPMMAKVIAHAPTRMQALDRLAAALDRTQIAGPRTNLAFLAALCRAGDFRAGTFDTGFIDRSLASLGAAPQGIDKAAAALGAECLLRREMERIAAAQDDTAPELWSPWSAVDGFQMTGARAGDVPLRVDGETVSATLSFDSGRPIVRLDGAIPAADAAVIDAGAQVFVLRGGRQTVVRLRDDSAEGVDYGGNTGAVMAPMHGKVLVLLAGSGTTVTRGQPLAILEAMKMEHTLTAPCDGTVAEVAVAEGDQVKEGARLMIIEPRKDEA